MDTKTIVRSIVAAELSEKQKAYREYFEGKLKKWKVDSPAELSKEDKAKFFEEVDKDWNAESESGKDGEKK